MKILDIERMNDNAIADHRKCVQSCRERLQFVLDYSGIPSYNALAKRLGLKRAENLYQILKGNNGISSDLALRINRAFPDIGIGWLKSGCGSPLPVSFSDPDPDPGLHSCMGLSMRTERNEIPLYTDLRFLAEKGGDAEPDRILPFPECLCPEAELATLCRTDALAPRILPGAYILLHRVASDDILYGGIYFVSTRSYQLCRIVRQDEATDRLRLLSTNPEEYGELVISRADILSLFHVCGTFHRLND